MSPYLAENEAQLRRLHALAERVTTADLSRRLPNGLTVAGVLVHLAFWDDYCRTRLESWERTGFERPDLDFDPLNATVRTLAGAIPDSAAVELALAAADGCDGQVARVSPQLAAALEAGDASTLLDRAGHRRRHLDQIDAVLGRGESA